MRARITLPRLAFLIAVGLPACSEEGGSTGGDVDLADAADGVVVVEARATSFVPANVTIQVGESVRWVAEQGTHTVTSGLSSQAEDMPGELFDEALDVGDVVEVRFEQAGEQPYFCRPHEASGMRGTITVTD